MIFSKKPDFTKQTHTDFQINVRPSSSDATVPVTHQRPAPAPGITAHNASQSFPQFLRSQAQQREARPVREIETKLLTKVLEIPKVSFQLFRSSNNKTSSCCSGAK
jgi:hypothetical protein